MYDTETKDKDGVRTVEITREGVFSFGQMSLQDLTDLCAEEFPGVALDDIEIEYSVEDITPCSCGAHSGEEFRLTISLSADFDPASQEKDLETAA